MQNNIAINANTVYAYKTGATPSLVARDVKVELPEVKPITTTASAMGDFDVTVIGQLENMEGKVTKIGVDMGLVEMLRQELINLEIRWAQQVFKEDGTSAVVGCKAIIRGFPMVVVPSIAVEKGNPSEIEVPFGCTQYQLFWDGQELWNIDRLNHILKINGTDYYKDLTSVL